MKVSSKNELLLLLHHILLICPTKALYAFRTFFNVQPTSSKGICIHLFLCYYSFYLKKYSLSMVLIFLI